MVIGEVNGKGGKAGGDYDCSRQNTLDHFFCLAHTLRLDFFFSSNLLCLCDVISLCYFRFSLHWAEHYHLESSFSHLPSSICFSVI